MAAASRLKLQPLALDLAREAGVFYRPSHGELQVAPAFIALTATDSSTWR